MVRSASPNEDGDESSQAGRYPSIAVENPDRFAGAVGEVLAGTEGGAVFVQPLVRAERGGIAFFDGFYYEATTAPGGNQELTSGRARGEVERGHLQRDGEWSRWLTRVHRCFGFPLDIEFAVHHGEYVLLQARPALFEVRRNETLSLANHREILGDPPSPWTVRVLEAASRRVLDYFAQVDRAVGRWNESYSISIAGRVWLNFGFFFRLMDHWGLPRSFVTEGVGGAGGGERDKRFLWPRALRMAPRLFRLQFKNLRTVLSAKAELARLDRLLAKARSLDDYFEVNVEAVATAVRVNFAINGMLSGITRLRRFFGIRGRAQVVTEAMLEEYEAMRAKPELLDEWLERYGHRGPFESDPARPRFSELRDLLARDLEQPGVGAVPPLPRKQKRSWFHAIDRRREWWRDELMKRWVWLRKGILRHGGEEAFGEPEFPQIDFPHTATRSRRSWRAATSNRRRITPAAIPASRSPNRWSRARSRRRAS